MFLASISLSAGKWGRGDLTLPWSVQYPEWFGLGVTVTWALWVKSGSATLSQAPKAGVIHIFPGGGERTSTPRRRAPPHLRHYGCPLGVW